MAVVQPDAPTLAAATATIAAALAGSGALRRSWPPQAQARLAALRAERAALERRVQERTAKLVQGEARLRDTLESMTDAFVALDRDFRVLDANQRALAIDGRPMREILGRTHWDLWPASVGTPVEAAYRRAMQDRVPVRLEHRYVSDMHDVWLDIRAFPTATGLGLFYADITERKRTEAALQQSEEARRLATEAAAVGIWQLCLVSGEGSRSAEAAVLFGVMETTFTAGEWLDAVHPADRAGAAEAWRRAVEEDAPYETVFRAAAPHPDGGTRWLLARGRVERNAASRPVRGLGVLLDVTERVRAEEATRAALAELRSVYDTAPIGLCVFDAAGRFRRINARLAEINGLPVEAHIGRSVREVLPDLADAAENLFRTVMTTGEPVLGVEVVGETPACPGMRRVWDEHWHPLRDADGRVVGVNVVAEEVTERRQAEERQLLLAREVDHRAKNALAMVQSVLRLTRAEDPKLFARTVEGRIAALARAQGLLAEVKWTGVDLRALLTSELAAFLPGEQAGQDAPGLRLEGAPLELAPAAVQPLAMIVHELATNATKYGALSVVGGRVLLAWEADRQAGQLRLRWMEAGGPPLDAAPSRRGFGSRVIEALVGNQLGGTLARHWNREGLTCEIALPLARALTRPRDADGPGLPAAPGGPAAAANDTEREIEVQAAR